MTSIITHRLTVEGQALFNDWFARLRDVLQKQKGFVQVRAFADAVEPGTRVILLEMESDEALRGWTSGADKAPLLREIEAVAAQPWTAARLRELG
jgi:antibiotic biosynthesis monooxygenase (ABM) superfamily enzyme